MSADDAISAKPRFDASLPAPYKENWREACRADASESPRLASYQAPGGEAIPFIQKSFRFSGGQSRDTAEYPFGGLWSNEYLNEKPQSLAVDGFLRGPAYIAQRNKLIEALRVPTDDDKPGYIDLPFWGRFPVVVNDSYEISEAADEQGQCAVSISFTRAGASFNDRMDETHLPSVQLDSTMAKLEAAAIDDFETKLSKGRMALGQLMAGFGHIKNTLISILGRVQGAQAILNGITNEALGIANLVSRGIRAPREYAQALFNAGNSIAGGVSGIKNSIALHGRENSGNRASPSLPAPDNEKNVAVLFLSESSFSLPIETATASQENTRTALENLYRTVAFLASARIIAGMDSLAYKKAEGYWRLLKKLEESIDRENPAVYAAIQDVRIALSQDLSRRELSREMIRKISIAAPLLYLAHYLGCDEDKIRRLNGIADSFVVEGDVIYV
ncbi:MAG: DNA circularization N-terminal domain-containing protein [Treponema sp.]|jgi:hypothetical protein|nr:DNA circularization N-terminal domain-containing protein [Treponema sp.]